MVFSSEIIEFDIKYLQWLSFVLIAIVKLIYTTFLFSQGGPYVLHLMDTYGGGFAVLFISISELIVLQWIYGACNTFSLRLQNTKT